MQLILLSRLIMGKRSALIVARAVRDSTFNIGGGGGMARVAVVEILGSGISAEDDFFFHSPMSEAESVRNGRCRLMKETVGFEAALLPGWCFILSRPVPEQPMQQPNTSLWVSWRAFWFRSRLVSGVTK